MPVMVVELIGLGIGALVWGLPHLIFHAGSPPFAHAWVALTVAAAGLALLRPGVRWQTGGGVGFGLLVVTAVQIIVGIIRDPTSHNLFPFEIVIALALGLPPAVAGVLLGKLVGRKVPSREVSGIVLVTLALAGAAVSAIATASDMSRMETLALKKVEALGAAQQAFGAAHPSRGFTCNLGELGVSFGGPINENHPSGSYRVNGMDYRGGTNVIEDGYQYRVLCEVACAENQPGYAVKCEDKPDPQVSFILIARPAVEEISIRRPPDIFCAGPDGAIRSVSFGSMYSCIAKGRIVRNVN